ncbi:hypothetical protein [uncultured Rikenella sp.]|uniref:hypothetical protein n=1 Tax=uncultured Rikenella sp. TaxID=368003 RepID=UPI00261BB6E3|nr:hypothetical protein [uncultured Rikenella sp.]
MKIINPLNKNKDKKTAKKIALGVLDGLLAGGAYLNYRMAQPKQAMSDLTLANIEAMAVLIGPELDVDPVNPDGCVAMASCKSGGTIKCNGQTSCESTTSSGGYKTVICDGVVGAGCY